jgi:hypothetical protein
LPTTDRPATLRRGDDVSNRDGKRRPRIDWDAAFAFFCSDPTASFPKVAAKFGVSDTAVRKHAKRDKWDEQRDEMHARAAATLSGTVLRSIQERQADTVRVAERLRAAALAEDANVDFELAVKMLPVYSKLEQLFAGEATDRVDIRKVQPVIVAFVTRVARHVPESAKGDFAQDLDWLEGELLAIEGPEVDAA